jgi:hypothetical protein
LEDKGNKMNKSAPVFFAIIIALWSVTSSIAGVELYAARKVVLGTYNSSGLGTHNMPWSYVHNHEISVDDQHQTYVLDRNAKRILMFATDGKFIKDIYLNNVDFNDRSETEGDDGYIAYSLKVTGDGKKFYLTEGGNETNWSIVDSSGTPIRKNISRKYYWLERIGHTNNFRSEPDNAVINEDLNVIKLIKYKAEKNSLTTVDTADNLYITKRAQKAGGKVVIEKVTAEGKQLWKKELVNCRQALRFVGTDDGNNVYILADSPLKVIKLDHDGKHVADIPVPIEPYFKKWEMVDWHVLSDGTIYCIPYYWALFNSNKGKKPSEFALYFFDRK